MIKKIRQAIFYLVAIIVVAFLGYISATQVSAHLNSKKQDEHEQLKEKARQEYTESILNSMQTMAIGDTLPDFVFEDLNRQPRRLSDLVNNRTVISFFDPHCENCDEEMIKVRQAVANETEAGYFVFISSANPRLIEEMRGLVGLKSPVLYDHRAEFMRSYDIFTYPFNVIVDENLVIQDIIIDTLDESDLKKIINKNKDIESGKAS